MLLSFKLEFAVFILIFVTLLTILQVKFLALIYQELSARKNARAKK